MKLVYLWILELVWWIGAFLIAIILIWPYYPHLIVDVPFLIPNIILTLLTVLGVRLTFMPEQSIWGQNRWAIFTLTFAFIPICIYAVKQYSIMNQYFTTSASWMHSFSYLLTLTEKSDIAAYIKTQFTWCAVAAFFSGISMSGRMILSSWKIIAPPRKF